VKIQIGRRGYPNGYWVAGLVGAWSRYNGMSTLADRYLASGILSCGRCRNWSWNGYIFVAAVRIGSKNEKECFMLRDERLQRSRLESFFNGSANCSTLLYYAPN